MKICMWCMPVGSTFIETYKTGKCDRCKKLRNLFEVKDNLPNTSGSSRNVTDNGKDKL